MGGGLARACTSDARQFSPNPKPQTPNPKPQTPNHQPHTPTHHRETLLQVRLRHGEWRFHDEQQANVAQVHGLVFGVWGMGFGVWGLGLGVWVLWCLHADGAEELTIGDRIGGYPEWAVNFHMDR